MRRFFISPEQIREKQPRIQDPDAHHIRTVLRLKPGDSIIVFNGMGAEYQARIHTIDTGAVRIERLRPLQTQTPSGIRLTMAQAYLKDKKMDQLVRMLTELGVTRWVPFIAARSVATPDEKRRQSRHDRWQKISREALKQCRRNTMMEILPTATFEQALAAPEGHDLKLIFWEGEGGRALAELGHSPAPRSVFVMVGPEGGFEEREYRDAVDRGVRAAHMGPRILRAETAAVAACTMVQYAFGDMGR